MTRGFYSHDPSPTQLALRGKAAAKALGISERTLWSLTARGDVPHIKLPGIVLYPLDALRAWLEERTRNPIIRPAVADQGGDA